MEKNVLRLVTGGLVLSIAASTGYAALMEVKDVQFTFGTTVFYDGASQSFAFNASAITGDLSIPTSPSYEYSIHNAVVSFTNSALVSDTSAGGIANGTFAGGVTLTVTGRLVENATNTEYAPAGSTLIIAAMDDATWTIQELFTNYAVGSAEFTTTGGLLYDTGLSAGNVDLMIDRFVMGFYTSTLTTLSNFGSTNITGVAPRVQLYTDAVPEPATLSLLGLGGLACLSRKRRNG